MKPVPRALASFVALGTFAASFPTLQATDLTASDGTASDQFGFSASVSGSIGLVGAFMDTSGVNSEQGSAYVFRNLDTATGTLTQNVKLTASDGAAYDVFGYSTSLSGSIGLVGAFAHDVGIFTNQGSAYVFRDLDTATGTITQNATLSASDGGPEDRFGYSVSMSGNIGLVGAVEHDYSFYNQGAAYVFRNLDTATGTVTEHAKLTASDGGYGDEFGDSVSLSGSMGLVGAWKKEDIGFTDQGSAYVFRNLDNATGTVTENVKLTASDGGDYEFFGYSVSLSGAIGLVGAGFDSIGLNNYQGSAYVFRNLDTAIGTVTEDVKLTASDGAAGDNFGNSVSQSGSVGLIGAYYADAAQGSAYLFRNLDTATGTVTENVKLTASGGTSDEQFGWSVSLDGDQFVIGASGNNSSTGKAHSGSVSSVTTLDAGSTSRTISGISFISQDDWIIGLTSDSNQVTLSAGDTANVTAAGKAVFIGKNAGSDNNTLIISGSATATQINVGAAGNTGNVLQLGTGGTTGTLSTDSTITNNGTVIFNRSNTITQGTDFSSAAITGTGAVQQIGAGSTVLTAENTYTGATTVNQGKLVVNGSISTSILTTVNSAGTIGGSGTVGAVTVMSGGTLAPGNSIESLATGNLTLSGGSNFAHEINNDAAAGVAGDLTAVNGTLSLSLLNDTNLVLTELGTGAWTYGEKLTLISYSGAWNGGLFKLEGSTLADDSTFNFSGINWKFNYNDAIAGSNWTGDLTGASFVTMTAVPEPGVTILGAFGVLALARRRRNTRFHRDAPASRSVSFIEPIV